MDRLPESAVLDSDQIWPRPRDAHWLALLRARAIENQAYVIGVNRTGNDTASIPPTRIH